MVLATGDGFSVTGTFTYDAATGAPESFVVANTSPRSTVLTVTLTSGPMQVPVPPGTSSFTAAEMAAMGWTDVNTQLVQIAAVSP